MRLARVLKRAKVELAINVHVGNRGLFRRSGPIERMRNILAIGNVIEFFFRTKWFLVRKWKPYFVVSIDGWNERETSEHIYNGTVLRCVVLCTIYNWNIRNHEERCWLFNFFASLCRMLSPARSLLLLLYFIPPFSLTTALLSLPTPFTHTHTISNHSHPNRSHSRSAFINNTRSSWFPWFNLITENKQTKPKPM